MKDATILMKPLKPCPVCGKPPSEESADPERHRLRCPKHVTTDWLVWKESGGEAIRAWNAAVDDIEAQVLRDFEVRLLREEIDDLQALLAELREVSGCPDDESITEWVRRMFRGEALEMLGTMSKSRKEALVELAKQRSLKETAISERDHARGRLAAEIDNINAIGKELREVKDALGVFTGPVGAVTDLKKNLNETDALDVRALRQRHGLELLEIANAMGLKTTSGLVESAEAMKLAADDAETLRQRLSDSRHRYLEKRLRHIVDTALGNCDDEL